MPHAEPVIRGRPRGVTRLAEKLIGVAGLAALRENDLYVVPGKQLRELAAALPQPKPVNVGESAKEETA